jgi:hypothetical protein
MISRGSMLVLNMYICVGKKKNETIEWENVLE